MPTTVIPPELFSKVSGCDVEEERLRDRARILLGASQATRRDLAEPVADGVLALHEARLRNMDARMRSLPAVSIGRSARAHAEHVSVD